MGPETLKQELSSLLLINYNDFPYVIVIEEEKTVLFTALQQLDPRLRKNRALRSW